VGYAVELCKKFGVIPAAAPDSQELALPWTFTDGQIKAKTQGDQWFTPVAYINHQLNNVWVDQEHQAAPPQGRWDLCPMTGLSADQAETIATNLGLRLPTLDEWNAVYKLQSPESWKASANLRDQTWKLQKDHMDELQKTEVIPNLDWASNGGHSHSYQARSTETSPSSDGYVFFATVTSQKGPENICNFIGNAAEYVKDGGAFYAIGGSAISDPAAVDQKEPVKKDPLICDVGFRLAADGISKGQSMQKWNEALAKEEADAPVAFNGRRP
jgi:hypothetical protein